VKLPSAVGLSEGVPVGVKDGVGVSVCVGTGVNVKLGVWVGTSEQVGVAVGVVVAVLVGFTDPQLPNQAAARERFVHEPFPLDGCRIKQFHIAMQ